MSVQKHNPSMVALLSPYFQRRGQAHPLPYDDSNVSNPPTIAELTAIFGDPGTLPNGLIGIVNDNAGVGPKWSIWVVNGVYGYIRILIAV